MNTTMTTDTLLAQSISAKRIQVQAQISSRKKLFQSMASLLCTALDEEVKEKEIYLQLWEREKLGNTGIGNGIALPHSRSNHATDAIVAIITLNTPIDYDSSDGHNGDLAFGLLVPQNANEDHLKLLANIARLVSDTDKKKILCDAVSAQDIVDKIQYWSTPKS